MDREYSKISTVVLNKPAGIAQHRLRQSQKCLPVGGGFSWAAGPTRTHHLQKGGRSVMMRVSKDSMVGRFVLHLKYLDGLDDSL